MLLLGLKLEPCCVDGLEATRVTMLGVTDPKGFIPNLNLKAVAMKSMSLLLSSSLSLLVFVPTSQKEKVFAYF